MISTLVYFIETLILQRSIAYWRHLQNYRAARLLCLLASNFLCQFIDADGLAGYFKKLHGFKQNGTERDETIDGKLFNYQKAFT